MNRECIDCYEWDLNLFLGIAVNDKISKQAATNEYEKGIYAGSFICAQTVIERALYHLTVLYPAKYSFRTLDRKATYINIRIGKLIKEKINEAKNKLHKDKKASLA